MSERSRRPTSSTRFREGFHLGERRITSSGRIQHIECEEYVRVQYTVYTNTTSALLDLRSTCMGLISASRVVIHTIMVHTPH